MDKIIRWLGTSLCLVGIYLTSHDVYPLNLYFGASGSFLWALIGIHTGDGALLVVEMVAVWIYVAGILR